MAKNPRTKDTSTPPRAIRVPRGRVVSQLPASRPTRSLAGTATAAGRWVRRGTRSSVTGGCRLSGFPRQVPPTPDVVPATRAAARMP